jgi:hypothetical protein
MSGRAIRTTSRIAFLFCGLISLFTAVPYAMLRGIDLPVQSEWVVFVVALALVGLFSVVVGLLPRSWIAKACKKDRDDEQLYSAPLKLLGGFAATFYLVAVVAFLAPHRWNLDPQLMSPAGGSLLSAGAHERGGLRITRPHPGIHMVGHWQTNLTLAFPKPTQTRAAQLPSCHLRAKPQKKQISRVQGDPIRGAFSPY